MINKIKQLNDDSIDISMDIFSLRCFYFVSNNIIIVQFLYFTNGSHRPLAIKVL